jgi:hypothetical protein
MIFNLLTRAVSRAYPSAAIVHENFPVEVIQPPLKV